ncbi:MAG: AmmeMemoRadiSam system radical SAM enzyme [Candidatus Altiarchaeales archaeon]|nr:AmmeMemoRadiSam system radical SAM enzyme [Candidatus Altiarchaeales archaeon]MBD3415810.1 AmmeMemoRadiSam system radical SAM enzyme [Candidatus Altiarchaeales archaeon]
MKEAMLYEGLDGSVRCGLCPHRCTIADGGRGLCGVRENRGGTLYSLVYGKPVAAHADPIEKKPLFHFMPGTRAYSISTVGCNLSCEHCQNHEISQSPREGRNVLGGEKTAEEVVSDAAGSGCASIAYTYTEPTVYMEYAVEIAEKAVAEGLKNVFVSNGYMTAEAREAIIPYLHADNIDLKSFSDRFYRELCGGSLEPVLETLKAMVKAGVWVEVTTLIIPGQNDGADELRQIADFISGELGGFVPWHVSRFHPDYKMIGTPPTGVDILERAVAIGRDSGLKYVYAGNLPHGDYENTYCPGCGELVVERVGFNVVSNKLGEGICPSCKAELEGVWK